MWKHFCPEFLLNVKRHGNKSFANAITQKSCWLLREVFHRTIESFRLENIFSVIKGNHQLELPSPFSKPWCHIQMCLKYLQRWNSYLWVALSNAWPLFPYTNFSWHLIWTSTGATWGYFLVYYHLSNEKRDWHPPHYNLLSASCWE